MKTNIFLNSYQQPENKLTYNFLALLEYINSKVFCEFLTKRNLEETPLSNIQTVYGGGTTNPDGSFDLTDSNNKTFKVYFENKTKRYDLTRSQIEGHLSWLKKNDLLLVVTPRKSDIEILRNINDNRIIFYTWSEIATQLKNVNETICNHFIDYGRKSGEFEDLGAITSSEINGFCEYFRSNFENKIRHIISDFFYEVDLSKFQITMPKRQKDAWGRNGVEYIQTDYEYDESVGLTYGQFFTIAYYYNTEDHEIQFKKGEPEICVFFDVHPDRKKMLNSDTQFRDELRKLIEIGFESNIDEETSNNPWRLFFIRRPLSEFSNISTLTFLNFTDEVFGLLLNSEIFKHKYFAEMRAEKYNRQ